MTNDPDHTWWSLIDQVVTGDAWAPFFRISLFLLLLGGITTGILFTLGPVAAGIGAGGGLVTGAVKRQLTRRNRK